MVGFRDQDRLTCSTLDTVFLHCVKVVVRPIFSISKRLIASLWDRGIYRQVMRVEMHVKEMIDAAMPGRVSEEARTWS
jgi:hypothetical protein